MVQGLRLHVSNAGGKSSILGRGTRSHMPWAMANKKEKGSTGRKFCEIFPLSMFQNEVVVEEVLRASNLSRYVHHRILAGRSWAAMLYKPTWGHMASHSTPHTSMCWAQADKLPLVHATALPHMHPPVLTFFFFSVLTILLCSVLSISFGLCHHLPR